MELTILEQKDFLGKHITVYGTHENPIFLAKDVAEWIEHTNQRMMLESVDIEEKLKSTILTSGQNREVWMLTENGLYEVLMQSRKPIAKEVKKAIKHILKEIRTKGIFATPQTAEAMLNDPDLMISLLEGFKKVKEEKKQLEIKNAKLQNRSDVYDKVFNSEKYLSGSQICKVLELGYGNKTLYKKLREIGIFFKNKNEPMQNYANKKWIMLKEKWIEGKEEPVLTPFFSQSFIPHLAMKLGAVVNNLNKIQST